MSDTEGDDLTSFVERPPPEVIPSPTDDDTTECRLFILDRSGSGQVTIMPMETEQEMSGIGPSTNAKYQTWSQIQGVKDFGVVVVNNEIYIIGGYNNESKICSMRMRK